MPVRECKRRMTMREFGDWLQYLGDPTGEKTEIELPQDRLIEVIKQALGAEQ